MPGSEEKRNSILIVSASEQFEAVVRRSLRGHAAVVAHRSGAAARRSALERPFDLIVIQMPLQDETGEQFALDMASSGSSQILLIVPAEVFGTVLDRVTDLGIMTLARPFSRPQLSNALRFLQAVRSRTRILEDRLRASEEKREELRAVSRAKLLLIERRHMTEEEAHRYIGRQAMNNGVSRRKAAESILEAFE
jgi:response regulator NasT